MADSRADVDPGSEVAACGRTRPLRRARAGRLLQSVGPASEPVRQLVREDARLDLVKEAGFDLPGEPAARAAAPEVVPRRAAR